ncbi:ABC transporter permease [Pseudothermotoga thermarum]|uniref:Transport permease protein n=1 Tax=Pseudothermotoga thermarum DSM 5069 TaxID=688269 RepID=F7YXN6_9THEM|nr:ABC transporter permease [Pseudothermotoga thermarum]AEH50680.1 ABC-2 type transporter [Pseudothermotoga thermarum DSM 5069]
MESLIREIRAAGAFITRNLHLTKRYFKWELVFFAYTVANTVTMGFIGKGAVQFGATIDVNYLVLYMLIGSILWGYLSVLFEIIAETVAWERWEDTIEYTFMAPVSRVTHLLSTCMYSVVYGILRSALILVIVALMFKLDLSKANFAGAAVVLAASSISFIGLGVMGAVLPLISPEKGVQVVHIFQALLLMFSGVYYEITVLPNWMQAVAKFSPATYALRGMRNALLEGKNVAQLWNEIFPLLLFGLVLLPLGIFVFSKVELYAKKKGLLKRHG